MYNVNSGKKMMFFSIDGVWEVTILEKTTVYFDKC